MYRAYVPEVSGSGYHIAFGSYVGLYNDFEGSILTYWDYQKLYDEVGIHFYDYFCSGPLFFESTPDPSSSEIVYTNPELFVQAAAKTVGDTSTVNPFEVRKNSAFTEAIKELVDDYYEDCGAQDNEILTLDDQIYVSIHSQIVE